MLGLEPRTHGDDVLQKVARIAFASMTDYATWGPDGIKLVGSERLTPEQTVAVAEISETTTQHGGSKRIKLHDKLRALELLPSWPIMVMPMFSTLMKPA